MAREKAASVAEPGAFMLAADTVVAFGRRILPKPEDAAGRARLPRRCSRAAATRC